MKNLRLLLLCVASASALLIGCSKKTDSTNSSAATTESASGNAATSGAKNAPASGRAVEITANDQMKFSLTEIRAKPGEPLSVTLKNVGSIPKFSMGHNFVVMKNADVVESFIQEAATAATSDYIPPSRTSDVVAHTKLLGPKEQDTVTFNAPSQPGRYPFLCSFPGHYQVGMKGDLIVE
ncbi:MAG TPA: azurin [Opitutus sp.]|nr:azurin [Opitutus sp.]